MNRPIPDLDYFIAIATSLIVMLIILCLFCSGAWADVDMDIISIIESNNNTSAYNPGSGARGMYQITAIAWKDVQNNFPALKQYSFDCAYQPEIARLFAEAYFMLIDRYLRHYGLEINLTNRLACYNQGIKLTRKGILGRESRNYIAKYTLLDMMYNRLIRQKGQNNVSRNICYKKRL
jgi:hypothetical protein